MRHQLKGISLMESLAAGAVMVLTIGATLQFFISFGSVNKFTTSMPALQSDATEIVNRIASSLREAPLCESDLGCTGTDDAAISNGAVNGLTIYTSMAGATVQYLVDGNGNFKSVVPGSSTTLATPTVALSIQYLLSSAGLHSMPTDPNSATWVTGVTSATDRKNLIAAKITATVTRNGLSGSYTTTIRLRNSPKASTTNY